MGFSIKSTILGYPHLWKPQYQPFWTSTDLLSGSEQLPLWCRNHHLSSAWVASQPVEFSMDSCEIQNPKEVWKTQDPPSVSTGSGFLPSTYIHRIVQEYEQIGRFLSLKSVSWLGVGWNLTCGILSYPLESVHFRPASFCFDGASTIQSRETALAGAESRTRPIQWWMWLEVVKF